MPPTTLRPPPFVHLLIQLSRRELLGKYQGSMLGGLWLVVSPLLMLGVFTLVFHGVFGMRWPGARSQSPLEFSLFLFVGLSVFQFFSETVNRAPLLIVSQPNLVTKVVFPVWQLPLVVAMACAVQLCVSLALLVVFLAFIHGVSVTWCWLPLLLPPLLMFVVGLAWLLAGVGVYARDAGPVTNMLTTLAMFLSPVFFSVSAAPAEWRDWFLLNPLAMLIEQFRGVLLLNLRPNFPQLFGLYVGGALVAFVGKKAFDGMQEGFADVL